MRNEFAKAILKIYKKYPEFVFITGDLGYMAFESLREVCGDRFINAGIAEQNMVSFASGMAYEGFIPWIYSIAPFAVLRPYEQIRNDICLHNLPVKIVGNGGGYGYGIMGSTHHALEDIAVMRVLPNMKVFVPFISEKGVVIRIPASDVSEIVDIMAKDHSPNYLRLNYAAKLDFTIESFRPWRKIKNGKKYVAIGTGPVLANIFDVISKDLLEDFEIWHVGKFPIDEMPQELVSSIEGKKRVLTIEEHRQQCGLNESIARLILSKVNSPVIYKSIHAKEVHSGKVGSQKWYQNESNLGGEGLKKVIDEFIYE